MFFYEKQYFYRAVIRIYNYNYYILFERKSYADFNNEKKHVNPLKLKIIKNYLVLHESRFII